MRRLYAFQNHSLRSSSSTSANISPNSRSERPGRPAVERLDQGPGHVAVGYCRFVEEVGQGLAQAALTAALDVLLQSASELIHSYRPPFRRIELRIVNYGQLAFEIGRQHIDDFVAVQKL